MEGLRAQATPEEGIRILSQNNSIQTQRCVWDFGGALGIRYLPKGAEFFSLTTSNPFHYGFACIAPLGCREGIDLVRVQGTF